MFPYLLYNILTSAATAAFAAQEMMKPNPLVCRPKLEDVIRISGFGSRHNAVGHPPKIAPQPVVPGR